MFDNEKLKAAFMTLLADFKADIGGYSRNAYRDGGICSRHDLDCSEAIFNWYLGERS